MIKEIFSSGGVGDALIVGLKISKSIKNNPQDTFRWNHYERHECHKDACLDIMRQFVQDSNIYIVEKPEKIAKETCKQNNGTYIDTIIAGYPNPYLDKPLGDGHFLLSHEDLIDIKDHIVIHMQAGRMHDNTKRVMHSSVVKQIENIFEFRRIVLIGPEKVDYEGDRIVNLTGQTKSVMDSLQVINDCALFIGHDGVMAYYSMMMKNYTIVSFHLPNLVRHYWNGQWAYHALAIQGAGNSIGVIPEHEKVKLLFKLVKSDKNRI